MKKIDKLILKSFFGPFILTAVVVTFILLTQTLMRYFDDFVGKDLGFSVFVELISYFSINITPVAFPLAVLLSSLMTFGNLGEHFELTAIKSAGISLLRALRPIFIFVSILTAFALYSNNYIVPKANLNAYSLLYDIRQKKPSMDIKEGAFYNGIPGYSIKANKKYSDNESLGDVIIYNHSKGRGNVEVILSDSAKMYTILNDQYLVMELFRGRSFTEGDDKNPSQKDKPKPFVRNEFERNKMIFSLSSFEMQRTDKELFMSNRLMKNADQLRHDRDSMRNDALRARVNVTDYVSRFYSYHLAEEKDHILPTRVIEYIIKEEERAAFERELKEKMRLDSLAQIVEEVDSQTNEFISDEEKKTSLSDQMPASAMEKKEALTISNKSEVPDRKQEVNKFLTNGMKNDSISGIIKELPSKKKLSPKLIKQFDQAVIEKVDSIAAKRTYYLKAEIDKARFAKSRIKGELNRIDTREREARVYDIYFKEKIAQAMACLVMFLIGAPLGAIIKKGGLGVPILISIVFFIFSYVISQTTLKIGRDGTIDPWLAVFASNLTLLPFGLMFLYQARNDSRLFEVDVYLVFFEKLKAKVLRIFKK